MNHRLSTGLTQLNLTVSEQTVDYFCTYAEALIEQNKVMNLTAITNRDDIATLHFLDSAALMGIVPMAGKSLIDVGTGAGFPGIPLKLLEPTLDLTLLDGLQKRLDWLDTLCGTLGAEDVKLIHGRAEEISHDEAYRDAFDIATSRAVASLPLLCEMCLPYVKVGGHFLSMKSAQSEDELTQAEPAIAALGGRFVKNIDYTIPHTNICHRVVVIEKLSPTRETYPRRWAKMQKKSIL